MNQFIEIGLDDVAKDLSKKYLLILKDIKKLLLPFSETCDFCSSLWFLQNMFYAAVNHNHEHN